MLDEGKIKVDDLITHRATLDQLPVRMLHALSGYLQKGYIEGAALKHPFRTVTALRTISGNALKMAFPPFPRDMSLGWGFGGKVHEKQVCR